MHIGNEMSYVEEFIKQVKIYDCDLTKVRIGGAHDGGYILMEELCKETPVVYSFGIGEDVSFELNFAARYPKVAFELYDPTINKLPQGHPNFKFYKTGINRGFAELGHNIAKGSLLKADVEWNEWNALLWFIDQKDLAKFSQLAIEFHIIHASTLQGLTPYFHGMYQDVMDWVNNILFKMYARTIEKLNKDFYCAHMHVNNSLPPVLIDGYCVPPLLELLFVRKDLVPSARESLTKFPIEGLDSPNKTDRPDIKIC